jgi:hypothetical protein
VQQDAELPYQRCRRMRTRQRDVGTPEMNTKKEIKREMENR